MAREVVLVTTKTTVSRETWRRTSADWFNQKQVCRGRIERENKWLLAPICAERHGEGLAETGSNRGKCAAEATREGLVTNSTNVSRETQSWRNGGDWLNQKQVFRRRHETDDHWLLVPRVPRDTVKKSRWRLIEPKASVPRKARDGGPKITSTNKSRKTRRRRKGRDWLNQKQGFRRWHESEY